MTKDWTFFNLFWRFSNPTSFSLRNDVLQDILLDKGAYSLHNGNVFKTLKVSSNVALDQYWLIKIASNSNTHHNTECLTPLSIYDTILPISPLSLLLRDVQIYWILESGSLSKKETTIWLMQMTENVQKHWDDLKYKQIRCHNWSL